MAGSQHRSTVGDYVTLRRGTTYKGSLVGEPGPALLGLGSIKPGGGFRIGHYKTYAGDCPAELMLFPGDLYAALKGATKDGKMIGSVARVPPTVPTGRLTQDTVKLVFRSSHPDDSSYLHWILRTPQYREYCAGHAMGSAVVALSRRDFLAYPVPQLTAFRKQVVALLDVLDDKIELNRRMNETLEAIARVLFKSWFVDFDPVRRNMARKGRGQPSPVASRHPLPVGEGRGENVGKAPPPSPTGRRAGDEGVIEGTAFDHLFPDSFEDSELGEIPKGWRLAPLPDIIDVNLTRALRKGVEAPYLDMANMPSRGHSPDEVVDRAFGSGMRFMNGDTLVARITPCLENGKTAFVDFLEAGEVGWGSTEYIVLRPKPPLPDEFAYCLARSTEFRDFAIQRMTGSSGRQRVPAESLYYFHVVVAPKPVTELFGQLIRPLFARSRAASKEGRTLTALRDTLLPKLISGELRVVNGRDYSHGE